MSALSLYCNRSLLLHVFEDELTTVKDLPQQPVWDSRLVWGQVIIEFLQRHAQVAPWVIIHEDHAIRFESFAQYISGVLHGFRLVREAVYTNCVFCTDKFLVVPLWHY